MGLLEKAHNPDFLLHQLSDIDEIIALTKQLIADNPDDAALRVSLQSDYNHRIQLVDCLKLSLAHQRHHAVSFVFKDTAMGEITIASFVSGLKSFSDLITSTCKELYNSTMELRFQHVFAGSVGVVLATPFDGALLESDMQAGISAVFNTISQLGQEDADTHAILQANLKGRHKLSRKFAQFLQQVMASGTSISIDWHPVDGEKISTGITLQKAKELHDIFAAHTNKPPETATLQGFIKGISLLRNTIDIQTFAHGRKKPVTLSNVTFPIEITESVKAAFDKLASLTVQTDFDYNIATEIEVKHKRLLAVIQNPS